MTDDPKKPGGTSSDPHDDKPTDEDTKPTESSPPDDDQAQAPLTEPAEGEESADKVADDTPKAEDTAKADEDSEASDNDKPEDDNASDDSDAEKKHDKDDKDKPDSDDKEQAEDEEDAGETDESDDEQASEAKDDEAAEDTDESKDKEKKEEAEADGEGDETADEPDKSEEEEEGDEEADGEEKPEEEPKEEPEEEPKAPPPPLYDGLDSGLAWFGDEPFVPATPTGYLPREPEAEAPAKAVAPGRPAGARKLDVRERFEARRKETEAAKTWYQKIPIPIYFTMPALLFIVGWILFVAKPWAGISDPSEAVDQALLTAPAVADQAAGMTAMGITAAEPAGHWQILVGSVLRMNRAATAGKLVVAVPPGVTEFEATCDLGIAEAAVYGGYQASFMIDDRSGIALIGNVYPKERRAGVQRQRTDYIAARRLRGPGFVEARQEKAIKPMHWYALRIVVEGDSASFYVNGTRIGTESPRPKGAVAKMVVSVANARVLVRGLKIKAAE